MGGSGSLTVAEKNYTARALALALLVGLWILCFGVIDLYAVAPDPVGDFVASSLSGPLLYGLSRLRLRWCLEMGLAMGVGRAIASVLGVL